MTPRQNPYVGPRPFTAAEVLPARDREVLELRLALLSVRILVLHSPSGAGKTSLIEARNGLRVEMERRGFLVRPTLRVGRPPPPDLADTFNRYELSVLRTLDDDVRPPHELAAQGLVGWFDAHRPADEHATRLNQRRRELLVFDQFEEILTADPGDDAGRDAFFDRLAVVLADPYHWALFIIREDHLGALDPWARRLPTLLAHRFRIDLLGADAAREAIRAPAEALGVRFADDALQHLIGELLQSSVQTLGGAVVRREGHWAEPVHLQVVCRRLWSQLAAEASRIELAQVRELGDVDTALAAFYDEQVRAIADATAVPERTLRDWIGDRLISAQGIRTTIMRAPDASEGLPNQALEALEAAHLIRGEERRKVQWYELSHDRLVPAIRRSNAAWAAANLAPVQLQAALWDNQGRTDELLLRDEAMPAAVAWAADHASVLTAVERLYLAHSNERLAEQTRARVAAARLADEQGRRLRQLRVGVSALALALLASLGLGAYAWSLWSLARAREAQAESSERLYKRVMFDGVLGPLRASVENRLRSFGFRHADESLGAEDTYEVRRARDDLRFYLLLTLPKGAGERSPITDERDFLTDQIRRRMVESIGSAAADDDAAMAQIAESSSRWPATSSSTPRATRRWSRLSATSYGGSAPR